MNEWLVLTAFAASGIIVAWMRRGRPAPGGERRSLDQTYLKGLNLLLNDQQDEAIDLFVRVLEVNHETVEIHLALGKLFRQRGEVDRAIRLHQNLIARPNLDREQKEQALFELGQDYFCAGLLDRAERLFADLLSSRRLGAAARRQLLRVYEEEKEWERAIQVAARLEKGRHARAVAHYHCELAEQLLERGETGRAQRAYKRALGVDRGCVRATLGLARIDAQRGRHRKAVDRLLRVRDQDADFLPLTVEPLMEAYHALREPERLGDTLEEVFSQVPGGRALEAWVELLVERKGEAVAREALARRLQERPTLHVVRRYLDLENPSSCETLLVTLRQGVDRLVSTVERFTCTACGFEAGRLYWRCPSCKGWGVMKPSEEKIGV